MRHLRSTGSFDKGWSKLCNLRMWLSLEPAVEAVKEEKVPEWSELLDWTR